MLILATRLPQTPGLGLADIPGYVSSFNLNATTHDKTVFPARRASSAIHHKALTLFPVALSKCRYTYHDEQPIIANTTDFTRSYPYYKEK